MEYSDQRKISLSNPVHVWLCSCTHSCIILTPDAAGRASTATTGWTRVHSKGHLQVTKVTQCQIKTIGNIWSLWPSMETVSCHSFIYLFPFLINDCSHPDIRNIRQHLSDTQQHLGRRGLVSLTYRKNWTLNLETLRFIGTAVTATSVA